MTHTDWYHTLMQIYQELFLRYNAISVTKHMIAHCDKMMVEEPHRREYWEGKKAGYEHGLKLMGEE